MAGEEDYLDEGQVPCHTEEVSKTVCFCETGCQTPSEWSDSGLAQKAEDAPPQLAPTRLVLLRTGTMRPNPLERPSILPFDSLSPTIYTALIARCLLSRS